MSLGIAGKRVLLVGINYWPELTGPAPYTTDMAEYLAEQGAEVTVLTGFPHYPEWRVPDPYRGKLSAHEHRCGVNILRLWHVVPRKMTALSRAAYEATFLTHAALRGLHQRPDLVLAITPALGAALAAASVSRRVGSPLVVVVQDLTSLATEQSGIQGGGRLTAATSRLEGGVLRTATTIAVASESFVPVVKAYGVPSQRIAVLRNWTRITPSQLSRDEARTRLGWSTAQFLAVHTGNIGLKQDLGNVVEAARLLAASAVITVLVGDGSQRRAVENQAKGLNNVRFMGLVDEQLYPVVLAAADVLIVNERPSVGEMSLPSKLTSYLAAGRPILAAVAEGGASYLELQGTGGAAHIVPPGDPGALAAALGDLAKDRVRRQAMSRVGEEYAAGHLSRDASLRTLAALFVRSGEEQAGAKERPNRTLSN